MLVGVTAEINYTIISGLATIYGIYGMLKII